MALHGYSERRPYLKYILLFILGIVGYIVIFAQKSADEITIMHNWVARELSAQRSTTMEPLHPFYYGGYFGYIDARGVIGVSQRVPYAVSYSQKLYSLFQQTNYPIVIYANSGEIVQVINQNGYPFIVDERMLVVAPNGNHVTAWNRREMQWERDFETVVSAVAIGAQYSVIGLLNGALYLIDREGRAHATKMLDSGALPLITASALSYDSKRIAVLSDSRNATLLILSVAGESINERDRQTLDVPNRALTTIHYLPESYNLFFYFDATLYYYADAEQRLRELQKNVGLYSVAMNNRYFAVVTQTVSQIFLTVYLQNGTRVMRSQLVDSSSVDDYYVYFTDDEHLSLLVGIDDRLLNIVEKKDVE